ncbi:MAG: hypothetical protein HQK54_17120 [Oligoflexales bacterium]|nr:hypothetical protein [Oligoflexales bacterium]
MNTTRKEQEIKMEQSSNEEMRLFFKMMKGRTIESLDEPDVYFEKLNRLREEEKERKTRQAMEKYGSVELIEE